SGRRRHTRSKRDWSSDVCSSDLAALSDAPGPASPPADGDVVVVAGAADSPATESGGNDARVDDGHPHRPWARSGESTDELHATEIGRASRRERGYSAVGSGRRRW